MFESVAARLISQITGRFCKNVDAKNLSISITKGEIKLQNVEINPSSFDELHMPITIKSGTVGKIEIKLSWTKLSSSPIEVCISDVFVVACPTTVVHLEEKDSAEAGIVRRALLAAEMERQKHELLSDGSSDGSDASMAKSIINKLIIKIQNVHVRYEQGFENQIPATGVAAVVFGIRLDNLNLESTDAERRPIALSNKDAKASLSGSKDASVVHKALSLVGFRIYASNSREEEAAVSLRLSGAMLYARGGSKPYDGFNGDFERSAERCNERAVYKHVSKAWAIWYGYVRGKPCWCVGKQENVGTDAMSGYAESLDPESTRAGGSRRCGPEEDGGKCRRRWVVYSFETQAWEEQSGIELVVTDGQHVRSPGDAREEREGAGAGGGSSLVLEPCGAVAWLTLVKAGAVKKKVPQISLSLELQPVQLVITEDVVCKGAGGQAAVADAMLILSARRPFLKIRPSCAYRGHYRIWWKYACERALDLVRLRRKQLAWDTLKKRIATAVRYSRLYRRALGVLPAAPLSDSEKDELSGIQDAEPLGFLQLIQKTTIDRMRKDVKRMLAEADCSTCTPQRQQGRFLRLFCSAKSTARMRIGGMQVELSEQQLKGMQALAAAHLQEAQDAEDDVKASTDEYVKMSVELAVAGVAVTLWGDERGGGHALGGEVARVGSGGGGACRLRLMRASVTHVAGAIAQRRSGFLGKSKGERRASCLSKGERKASRLEVRLKRVRIQHYALEREGNSVGCARSEVFDILASERHTCSWRHLLQLAAQFEHAYREADTDGGNNLNTQEVRRLLAEIGLRVKDKQLQILLEKLDTNHDGSVSMDEFVQLSLLLCSKSSTEVRVPIPSTVLMEEDVNFLVCSIENNPNTEGEDCNTTKIELGRLEIQLATFPLRNVLDWLNFLSKIQADGQRSPIVERVCPDEAPEHAGGQPQLAAGIPALVSLRASFECDTEDIFVPPSISSSIHVEMKGIDVGVHDILIGEAAMFFRVGNLCLSTASSKPTDCISQYEAKAKLALERIQILYARSKLDMDWDLEHVLAQTTLTCSTTRTMPQDLSGLTQEDELTLSDSGFDFQLSLRHILFLQAMQKVFGEVQQGNAELLNKSMLPQDGNPRPKSRHLSGRASKARDTSITRGGVTLAKCQRNIDRLNRIFTCRSRIVLGIIDDLPGGTEQYLTSTPQTKVLQFVMHDTEISETLNRWKPEAEVQVTTTLQVQAASTCLTAMETLLDPAKVCVDIKTSIGRDEQSIMLTALQFEFTITPDHIERIRTAAQKLEQYAQMQELRFKLHLQSQITEGFKQMSSEVLEQKLSNFLADLDPGARRKIQNRTNMFIHCRVYDSKDFDTCRDSIQPIIQAVLRPGSSITFPKDIIAAGVMLMQPFKELDLSSTNSRQEQMVHATGSWSRPEELTLRSAATKSSKGKPFVCEVLLTVQISMAENRAASILTEKASLHEFLLAIEKAMRSEGDHVKQVIVRRLMESAPGILLLDFSVSFGSDLRMEGVLFDCAAGLNLEKLQFSLLAAGALTSNDQLCMLKEPVFERSLDCSSTQLPNTNLFFSSNAKKVEITAPWKLSNVLPKSAIFHIYVDPIKEPVTTFTLEAGQEMMQYTTLTHETSVWITVQFDEYCSTRQKISRNATKIDVEMQSKTGDKLSCVLETSSVGNSADFLVTLFITMVIVNRTGLGLSIGRCRRINGIDTGDKIPLGGRQGCFDLEIDVLSASSKGRRSGKKIVQVGNDWVISMDKDLENVDWNTVDPDITMLHLPDGGWAPCIKMDGNSEWMPLNDHAESMRISGPPLPGSPEGTEVSYNLGVTMCRGLSPFHRTVYVTLMPKYTVINETGLSMHVCTAEDFQYKEIIFAQIKDTCSLATLGLFRVPPPESKDLQKSGHSEEVRCYKEGRRQLTNATTVLKSMLNQKEKKRVSKLRIRLLEDDGLPKTQLSEPFTVDDEKSVPLRLLHQSKDMRESVENAVQVLVTIRKWDAAIFVEITNAKDCAPMYQITNWCTKSNSTIRIWQPQSRFADRGAVLVQPRQTVPFGFDDPDRGALVTFCVDGYLPKTINAKHPSQSGYLEKSSAMCKPIKFITCVSGYTRKLQIFDVLENLKDHNAIQKNAVLMSTNVCISRVGLSLVALDRTELMYASLLSMNVSNTVTRSSSKTQLRVHKFQIDNQTSSGEEVMLKAGSKKDEGTLDLECTFKKNLEVTAMPYFELVEVSIAPFVMQMHEIWLQRLQIFEHDCVRQNQDVTAEVSKAFKYRRRALIGKSRELEEELETLSFLGKGVKLRQQFFQKLHLGRVHCQVTIGGLACISLRNPVEESVGPISTLYGILHRIGQKIPIPELDATCITLPELIEDDMALDAGSAGLSGVITQHYKSAIRKVGLKILSSGSTWSELLMTMAERPEERLARQERKATELGSGRTVGLKEGVKCAGTSVIDGVAGTLLKPLEGAQRGGVKGFFGGIGRGVLGVVTKPLAGMITLCQPVGKTLRKKQSLEEQRLGRVSRVRIPRAVFGDHLLRRFDEDDALAYCALQIEEVRLRRQGRNAQAQDIYSLKSTFFGFCRLYEPKESGLIVSSLKLVLVKGLGEKLLRVKGSEMTIESEFRRDQVKQIRIVGEDAIEITTASRPTPTSFRLAWPAKRDMMDKIISLMSNVVDNPNSNPKVTNREMQVSYTQATVMGGTQSRFLTEAQEKAQQYEEQVRQQEIRTKLPEAQQQARPELLPGAQQQVPNETELDQTTRLEAILQTHFSTRFSNIFEAWIYFDVNGDWSVSTSEFVRQYKNLKMPIPAIEVLRIIDKIGYGTQYILMREFVFAFAWHDLPEGGKKEAVDKAVGHHQLRRRMVLKELQARLSVIECVAAAHNDDEFLGSLLNS